MSAIRKAVFPVAGLGTRFLPATKVTAKEMLPVIDKPLIQYATEEAIAAGITELIFVTGRTKRSIEDHYDSTPELERELRSRNKLNELAQVQEVLPPGVTCIAVRQASGRERAFCRHSRRRSHRQRRRRLHVADDQSIRARGLQLDRRRAGSR